MQSNKFLFFLYFLLKFEIKKILKLRMQSILIYPKVTHSFFWDFHGNSESKNNLNNLLELEQYLI